MEVEENSPAPSPNAMVGKAGTRPPDPQTEGQDCRAHSRYAVDEISTLKLVAHGLSLQCRILDISLEGCRLRTQERLTAGTRTRVEVMFKVNGISFRFLGIVQWTDGQNLVGIRFVEMIARRREQLAEVISEIEAVAKAKREKAAAESAAAEKEAQEGKEAADRPFETQQKPAHAPGRMDAREQAESAADQRDATMQLACNASAGSHGNALRSPQQPAMRDRRVHARLDVNSIATILLVNIGSRLKGRIVDLSASGCRIRCDERFPVGIYTRVETEFRFEIMPFLLGGVVQNIHDPHTVGIRFLDMSHRKREQLEHLIAELSAIESMHANSPEAVERGSGESAERAS